MKPRRKRRELYSAGKSNDRVRVVIDTKEQRTVVYYRLADGTPKRAKYPRTPEGQQEAVAFADGWLAERKRQAAAALEPDTLTIRKLWEAFKDTEFSDIEGEGVRDATRRNYTGHWNRFERTLGKDRDASSIKVPELAKLKKDATGAGIALNQIRQLYGVVRTVFRWGVEHELLTHSPLVLLRMKDRKDAPQPKNPDAFSEEEFDQILRQIDYTDARQWRAWVAIMLAGHHGQRARAIQNLRWRDVDLEAGTITWPARFNKQGRDLTQPILWETWSALLTARQWREKAATYRVLSHHKQRQSSAAQLEAADWVLFAERDKTKAVSYQTLHYHLGTAQDRAGITRRDFRGFHGFKKLTVSRVIAATGDQMLGLQYVGNKSARHLANYDKTVDARVIQASEVTARISQALSRNSPDGPETQNAPAEADAQPVGITGDTE